MRIDDLTDKIDNKRF